MLIAINGFMGCGKSCIGKMLSERLSCRLIDLDRAIEEKYGRTIPEIFASEGEAAFRGMEKDTLTEILRSYDGCDTVLSLGGGTVTTPECAEMIREKSFCIYLRATVETLVKNLHADFESRPMLSNDGGKPSDMAALRSRIEELMAARSAIYENCAGHIVDIDGKSFGTVTEEIMEMLFK